MDEVTEPLTEEGKRSVRALLDRATPGCTVASDGPFLSSGWGLYLVNPYSTDPHPYISEAGNLTCFPGRHSADPLTDAELNAVLEAGGFKPVDGRTCGEGYADGLTDGSQSSICRGFDAGFEEGFDEGVNLASKVACVAPGVYPALAIEAAKKARLAYWESLGKPRNSEPKDASLFAWIAAVSAAEAV